MGTYVNLSPALMSQVSPTLAGQLNAYNWGMSAVAQSSQSKANDHNNLSGSSFVSEPPQNQAQQQLGQDGSVYGSTTSITSRKLSAKSTNGSSNTNGASESETYERCVRRVFEMDEEYASEEYVDWLYNVLRRCAVSDKDGKLFKRTLSVIARLHPMENIRIRAKKKMESFGISHMATDLPVQPFSRSGDYMEELHSLLKREEKGEVSLNNLKYFIEWLCGTLPYDEVSEKLLRHKEPYVRFLTMNSLLIRLESKDPPKEYDMQKLWAQHKQIMKKEIRQYEKHEQDYVGTCHCLFDFGLDGIEEAKKMIADIVNRNPESNLSKVILSQFYDYDKEIREIFQHKPSEEDALEVISRKHRITKAKLINLRDMVSRLPILFFKMDELKEDALF